jgi:hypothetical protein
VPISRACIIAEPLIYVIRYQTTPLILHAGRGVWFYSPALRKVWQQFVFGFQEAGEGF